MNDLLHRLIGSDAQSILWWQMSIRGILIFFYALVLLRLGGRRIFGKNTSFDIILGVIYGSILSRALTGNARFIPTLAAATTLIFLHLVMAKIMFRSKRLGHLIKGKEIRVVESGELQWAALKKTAMTEHDIKEAVRLNGSIDDIDKIRDAYLERNGSISVLKRE